MLAIALYYTIISISSFSKTSAFGKATLDLKNKILIEILQEEEK